MIELRVFSFGRRRRFFCGKLKHKKGGCNVEIRDAEGCQFLWGSEKYRGMLTDKGDVVDFDTVLAEVAESQRLKRVELRY